MAALPQVSLDVTLKWQPNCQREIGAFVKGWLSAVACNMLG